MRKVRQGVLATAMKVKAEAFKRELKRQGISEGREGWFSLERAGFAPDELQDLGSAMMPGPDTYVAEGTSSGAVSNAYRSGWDAVFGRKPRAKA